MYTSHEVYREVRYRAKLERITPVQSQCIDKILAGRERVEDSVIEEIVREVFYWKGGNYEACVEDARCPRAANQA